MWFIYCLDSRGPSPTPVYHERGWEGGCASLEVVQVINLVFQGSLHSAGVTSPWQVGESVSGTDKARGK